MPLNDATHAAVSAARSERQLPQCHGCGGTGCDAVGRCQYCGRVNGYRTHEPAWEAGVRCGWLTRDEAAGLMYDGGKLPQGSTKINMPHPTATERVRA